MAKIALKRTSLYAGGTSPAKLLQARFYNEDCLVYDLEGVKRIPVRAHFRMVKPRNEDEGQVMFGG